VPWLVHLGSNCRTLRPVRIDRPDPTFDRGVSINRRLWSHGARVARCTYDDQGNLINEGFDQGTYDLFSPFNEDGSLSILGVTGHFFFDPKLFPLFNENGKLVPTSHRWGHEARWRNSRSRPTSCGIQTLARAAHRV